MKPIPDQMGNLNHLAKAYPSVEAVAEAIINLQAQLNNLWAPSILFRIFTVNSMPLARW